MKKENKGITLIALVITIIVMLILVGVTITMAVNGGLFEKAGEAATKTNNAVAAEQALANGAITVGDKYYNSIGEYMEEIQKEVKLIEFKINTLTFKAEQGMTWEKWIDSSYDEYGLKIKDGIIYNDSDEGRMLCDEAGWPNYIEPSSKIMENEQYYMCMRGETGRD